MTCNAELTRHYATRAEAHAYLASRGFLPLPGGWQNGRWTATLKAEGTGFVVTVWLQVRKAA
jgi:hypothetical protein